MTRASSSLPTPEAALRSLSRETKLYVAWQIVLILCGLLGLCCSSFAQAQPAAPSQVDVADLNRQIRSFLQREVTAHVVDIKTLDPPPERVVGALTTGEFSWGNIHAHTRRLFRIFRDEDNRGA